MRAAHAGVKVFQANLGLARAARIPDIKAGPIYETASDTTSTWGYACNEHARFRHRDTRWFASGRRR